MAKVRKLRLKFCVSLSAIYLITMHSLTAPLPIVEIYSAVQGEGSKAGIPNIVVRFTGCTHRCQFGRDEWCDTWHTSVHPEKGKYTLENIRFFFLSQQHISQLMITGGSPTLHPEIVQEVMHLFYEIHQNKAFFTLETEGSFPITTTPLIDLVSLSPKFSNSQPRIGSRTPKGKIVDTRFIKQHNQYRMNIKAMQQLLNTHKDYHIKIVVDKEDNEDLWDEISDFETKLAIPRHKIYLMPAGSTLERVQENYAYLLPICTQKGYCFSGRSHIIAFGNRRKV